MSGIGQRPQAGPWGLWSARAPGRIDLMGGIADYCGSLVLETPMDRLTTVHLSRTREAVLRVSHLAPPPGLDPVHELPWQALREGRGWKSPEGAGPLLKGGSSTAWAAYLLGPIYLAALEGWIPAGEGMHLWLESEVPWGAGVSSSAALEVAALRAACAAWGCEKDGTAMALLAQAAENRVVGAPCGVMDQAASLLGQRGALLELECRPCEVRGHLPLPEGMAVFGLNTAVKHSVGGTAYGEARVAARMAQALLAEALKAEWDGRYLAALDPGLFQSQRLNLPIQLKGSEFLAAHGPLDDPAVRLDPAKSYAVRAAADHHVGEGDRVLRFAELLRQGDLRLLGAMMKESHLSYTHHVGLGCPEADALVSWCEALGTAQGIYGAKISGGGAGGTVAILAEASAEPALRSIAARYAREFGREADLFKGGADGALALPVLFTEPR